ncbi:type III-B CRISPR module RAMP protein Cmr1 [Sulfurihydrogenibium sp.]|jgi:CRISPR type III-B/RAMP module RAMP protein Cmr1|uniref:type III-B CRISPR module RAMP protein Cmr1 n=1 Tax=Sulfurihydrogenibium sp. TaxID=2053621 RepID=UPI0026059F34|nr:type III-B CRISPR module RAMP protein Cmr1 [Sulfurihydrogenibium sp.]
MEEAKFKVEIITPTIMGGANSRELDSILIRPTEIKSAMRQAFRLIAGKYVEHNKKGIEKLYELESEIFGNTQGKGKFRLIVDIPNNLETEKIKLLPHKNDFSKLAILQNQTFDLKIISYKYPVEFYKALLNVAFLLGVGHRRNRLFGNMQIEKFGLKDEVGKIDKFFLDKGYGVIKTNNPLFACFSEQEDGDNRNFSVFGMPLKDEFIPINKQKFENTLKNLYEKVIHKIEEKDNLKFILGGVSPRRQASFVNFSILKVGQSYRLFVIGFYYKNEKFKYDDWKDAIEKAKELTENTFKK